MSSSLDVMIEKSEEKVSEGSSGSPEASEVSLDPETSDRAPTRRTRSSTKSTSPSLITYSKDELEAFRISALSSKWPPFLDENFKNARGHWDPDRWHQNRKRGSTPPPDPDKPIKPSLGDRPTSSLSTEGKSRRDPKERIKADQQDTGLVLGPQRRSFLTGCQGSVTSSLAGGQQQLSSAASSSKKEEISLRPDTSRRVGSGRILNRGRDQPLRDRDQPLRDRDGIEEQDFDKERDRDNRRFDHRREGDRFGNGGYRGEPSDDPRRRNENLRNRDEDPRRRDENQRNRDDDPRRRRNDDPKRDDMRHGDEYRRRDDNRDSRRRVDDDRRRPDQNRDRDQGIDESESCGDPVEDARRHIQNEERRRLAEANDPRPRDEWYGRDDYNGSRRGGGHGRDDRGRGGGSGRFGGGGGYREADEPEWMSTTINQNELMELRGFDDSPEKEARGSQPPEQQQQRQPQDEQYRYEAQHRQEKQQHRQEQQPQQSRKAKEQQLEERKRAEFEEMREASKQNRKEKEKSNVPEPEQNQHRPDQNQNRPGSGDQLDQGFNIDDVLHLDVIPGLAGILDDDPDYVGSSNLGSSALSGQADHEVPSSNHGGRFSQFFQRPKPQQPELKLDERRSSIQDELCVGASILRDINQGSHHPPQPLPMPQVRIPSPGDPSAYFAPVSPAAKTTNESLSHLQQLHQQLQHQQQHHNNPIMNMLRMNATGDMPPMPSAPSLDDLRGKNVRSVEELENDIKQLVGIGRVNEHEEQQRKQRQQQQMVDEEMMRQKQQQHVRAMQQQQQQQQAKKIEMSAFEKFAAMIGTSDAPPQNVLPFQNVYHNQMGMHQGNTRVTSGGLIRPSPIPANAPTEQEILAGLIGPRPSAPPNAALNSNRGMMNRQQPPPQQQQLNNLLTAIYHAPFNPDVLQRPEALALQAALQSGQVTLEILLQQFANANMPPLQREILLNVLKFAQSKGQLGPHIGGQTHGARLPNRGGGLSPLPGADTLAILQQKQQRLSPGLLGSGGLTVVSPTPNQRIPSPQELQVHTQQILQNALIKRKLEEQKENYRRRQEGYQLMPGGETPNSKVRGTDSPLAFAPTAVMKKIAADRRDSDPVGGKIPVPELKISSSAEKENGEMFNIIPPGGGMLPLPSLSAQQQQQAQAMLQQQQQQQQRMRIQAMQHQMAVLQQATSPTGLIEQQQRLMMFQQHQMQQQQQQQLFGHQQQQQHFTHQQHQGYQGRSSMQQQLHQPQQVGLSRFFSPEVLAQAQSGNGPAMPPLPTQKALTLEEIERQAAAVRI